MLGILSKLRRNTKMILKTFSSLIKDPSLVSLPRIALQPAKGVNLPELGHHYQPVGVHC